MFFRFPVATRFPRVGSPPLCDRGSGSRPRQLGIRTRGWRRLHRHPWPVTCGKVATGDLHLADRPEGGNTMQDFKRGTVRANQLTFEYLTAGDGPLALCVHGFPDSPYSYRYLLPALAEAGYRAVAPFNRGFAPTELPDDRHHIHSSTMAVTRSPCTRHSAATQTRS